MEKTKIACLGWGSLIWRPKDLLIQNKWFEDGPLLPIEFTRISNDDRATLIIDKDAQPVRTLWALMIPNTVKDCIKSLADREGTNENIICQVSTKDIPVDSNKIIIKEWLINNNLDIAIWTGLSFSDKTNSIRPDIKSIIKHLDNLVGKKRTNAEEYIRKAPKQIDTEYRRMIEAKLAWTNIE